jgi:hypothetical protein
MRRNPDAYVRVIPTLGQHVPHTEGENKRLFGSIPNEIILAHDWRKGFSHVWYHPSLAG